MVWHWAKGVRMTFLLIAGVLVFVALVLFGCQRKLIYHPREYAVDYKSVLPARAFALEYEASCGKQTAYYIPPSLRPTEPPSRLWIFFGGNGSLALDWQYLVHRLPDERAGVLLIDYPGYGTCEGQPSAVSIADSSRKVLPALAKKLGVDEKQLEGGIGVVGHSLGCAAGLNFAYWKRARVFSCS